MKDLLLFFFFLLLAQIGLSQDTKTITGVVLDENSEPLVGATVSNADRSKGAITDLDGGFQIQAENGEIFTVSYLGKQTEQFTVGENDSYTLTLKEDNSIEAVVVTGFQEIDREEFIGSSQTLSGEEIKLDGVSDVSRMLEGRAAGVNIQNVSGTFGSSPRITIRGSSSILGDSRPLWVVDGAILEDVVNLSLTDLTSGDTNTLLGNAVSGLNPNDIESIEILRDASASALYGARALNGVVVITTKSGRRDQKTTITASSEFTTRPVPKYSNLDLLNSQETVAIYRELERKGHLSIASTLQGRYGGIYNLMYRLINTYDEETGRYGLENSPQARAEFLRKYELANTDWFDELYRTTPTQNHSIGFRGGSENATTYASLSLFSDPGWSISDEVQRLTGNLNNSFFFNDNIKVTTQVQASYRDQRAPGTFSRQADTETGSFTRNFDINPFSYALNTSRAVRPRDENGNLEFLRYNWAPFNILHETENNLVNIDVLDLRLRLGLEYDISDNVKYNFLGTGRFVNSIQEHEIRDESNAARAYRADETTIVMDQNIFLFRDPDNPNQNPQVVLPRGGILRKTDNSLKTFTLRNSLDINKEFGGLHDFNLYLAQVMRQNDRSEDFFSGYGLQYSRGLTPFTDPGILDKAITEGGEYFRPSFSLQRELTFIGKLAYNYDQRYIVNISGNYEGSNRAGRSQSARWLPTFNVGGRWNIHREKFINSDWISMLAFRPSYGLIALLSDNVSNNLPVLRNRITNRLFAEKRENYIEIEDLENSELTWEKTYELNLGFDVGLFENDLSMSFDLYSRRGVDLIDEIRTSGIGGEFFKFGNNANMSTEGIDFQMNTRNIKGEDFTWNTALNFSYFKQEITKILQQPNVLDLVDETGGNLVGYPSQSMFSFDFDGLNYLGFPTYNLLPSQDEFADVDFQDINDNSKYLVYEGSTLPNMMTGLSNSFRYKNWDLDLFFTHSGGNKIRLTPSYKRLYSDLDVFPKEFYNRWLNYGDEEITDIPVIPAVDILSYNRFTGKIVENPTTTEVVDGVSVSDQDFERAYNAYNYSTARVVDGDFIRMRSITLGYNLPSNMLEKTGLSSLRLRLQATNPFLLYSDSRLNGQDPEFFQSGGVAQPVSKQYTFTLNLGL